PPRRRNSSRRATWAAGSGPTVLRASRVVEHSWDGCEIMDSLGAGERDDALWSGVDLSGPGGKELEVLSGRRDFRVAFAVHVQTDQFATLEADVQGADVALD